MRTIWIFSILFLTSLTVCSQDFFDVNVIKELKFVVEDDNWQQRLKQMKEDGGGRLEATMTWNGETYEGVGIRYKGNSSYFNVAKSGSNKLPFNIKVNDTEKKLRLPGRYQKIKLANSFRDPSFLREILAYEIARNYLPASRANFIKLFVNDTYLGLYHNTESVDDEFLEYHYDEEDGTFIKCDPNWRGKKPSGCPEGEYASLVYLGEEKDCYKPYYELESKEGWEDLIELSKILNETPDQIENILNIDQVLWMHAFNNVVVNLDSYVGRLCHNYYLYKDANGRFQPLIWDMNLAFGGFRFDGQGKGSLDFQQMAELSPYIHLNNKKRPLISVLLSNERYRKMYIAHFNTIYKDYFESGTLLDRVKELSDLVRPHVQSDENKLYSMEAFENSLDENVQMVKAEGTEIPGLIAFIKARKAYLQTHPLLTRGFPVISDVVHNQSENDLVIRCKAEGADKVSLFYRTIPNAPFKELALENDGQNFSGTLPYLEGTQYYIFAENDKTAAFAPPKAAFEFYEVK